MVTVLLGTDGRIEVDWYEEHVYSIALWHSIGVKMSATVRGAPERVVTIMLPSRWRARWDLEKTPIDSSCVHRSRSGSHATCPRRKGAT